MFFFLLFLFSIRYTRVLGLLHLLDPGAGRGRQGGAGVEGGIAGVVTGGEDSGVADWSGAAAGTEVLSACQRQRREARAGGAEGRQVGGMGRGQQGGDGWGGGW